MSPERVRRLRDLALPLALGLAAGITLSWAGDAHPLSLLAVIAAPLLWLALAAFCLMLALARQPRLLARFAVGGIGLLAPLHAPWFAPAWPPTTAPELFLAHCPPGTIAPPPSLTIVSWNAHGLEADEVEDVADLVRDADVLVLQETTGQATVAALARALDGDAVQVGHNWHTEGRFARGGPRGFGPAIVAVGAELGRCDGARGHMLVMPGIAGRSTRGLVALAHGTPIVDVHQDRVRHPLELVAWPQMLSRNARRIAAVARAAGPWVVVAGDTNTIERFHRYHNTLQAAGLESATPHDSWPAQLRGRPFLPLYALDRVYVGSGWDVAEVDTLRIGGSDHLAVRVELRRSDL